MARNARVTVDDGDLRRHNAAWDVALGRVQSLNNATGRLAAQKGGVAVGGGRGVFAGTLRDFSTRDEFVGRAGTMGRGLMAGRIGGAMLAFISVEEFSRGVADYLKGAKSFNDIMKETLLRLLPSVLRESLPTIIDEIGHRTGLLENTRREQLRIADQHARALQGVKEANEWKSDNELNRDVFRWESKRFHDSEEYKRRLEEASVWER